MLNQILRQSTTHLPDGPFAILVNFTRVLDFDVKRKYFRQELEKMHDGSRRGDETAVNVNRSHVFEESFRELHRKSPDEWKNKFYVVFERTSISIINIIIIADFFLFEEKKNCLNEFFV